MSEDRMETGAGATQAPVCYRHQDRETYVSCTRCERPICPDCMRPASVGFQCPECVREGAKTVRPARTALGGGLDGEQGLVTKVLMGANIGVFLLTVLSAAAYGVDNAMRVLTGSGGGRSVLYQWFAMHPTTGPYAWIEDGLIQGVIVDGVAQGQLWRLVTAGFLHYGMIHLLFNMWALFILGRETERLVGRWRFVAVYLLSGVGGALGEYLFGGEQSFAAGASGSVFGLFGALFFFFKRLNMDPRGIVMIVVLNFALGLFIANISWLGHLGGLIVGALTGALLAYAPRGPSRGAIQVAGLAIVAVALAGLVVLRTATFGA
jgi:membrane associated rhomboid family serine protease